MRLSSWTSPRRDRREHLESQKGQGITKMLDGRGHFLGHWSDYPKSRFLGCHFMTMI
jgi:hypothetical protein